MLSQERPEITYPCEWEYRIIGENKETIKEAVFEIIHKAHTFLPSKESKTGKYVSFNVVLVVENEEERNAIFAAFKAHKAVKMVI